MAGKRTYGEGGLSWDPKRRRWIASVTIGYDGRGKRIFRRASDRTKTGALAKLKANLRDLEDGLAIEPHNYTVADAVGDWLSHGLNRRSGNTRVKCRSLANNHIMPDLGAKKLRELSAEEIDRWLTDKAQTLSTD